MHICFKIKHFFPQIKRCFSHLLAFMDWNTGSQGTTCSAFTDKKLIYQTGIWWLRNQEMIVIRGAYELDLLSWHIHCFTECFLFIPWWYIPVCTAKIEERLFSLGAVHSQSCVFVNTTKSIMVQKGGVWAPGSKKCSFWSFTLSLTHIHTHLISLSGTRTHLHTHQTHAYSPPKIWVLHSSWPSPGW